MNELIEKINEHISTLNPKYFPNEAVNWAQVRCSSITEGTEWSGDGEPDLTLQIQIVKASGDMNSLFKDSIYQFVSSQLPNEKRPIYVVCEW